MLSNNNFKNYLFSLAFCLIMFVPFAQADKIIGSNEITVKPLFGQEQTKTLKGGFNGTDTNMGICELIEWTSECHANSDRLTVYTKMCCTFRHPDGTVRVTCDDSGITAIEVEDPSCAGEYVDLDALCDEYLGGAENDEFADLPAHIRAYCETGGYQQ
jgi:hypothetical protein